MLQDILLPDLSVSGMGAVKGIVEAPHQGDLPVQSPVGVDARQLFLPFIFGDPVVVVKPSLGAPAQVHGGGHMGPAPFHDCL